MGLFARSSIDRITFALILVGSSFGGLLAHAQNPVSQSQSSGTSNPTRRDSVEVVAKLSPEEAEEGKLNDAYELIAQQQRKGACTAEVIERYKSEVITLAEKSAFKVPKNKFLFLANRDIGDCYLAQQKFVEAEVSFQSILQYAPVWPGTDDSDYPITFRQIAEAQMGQQRWPAAEDSLQKSISLFDSQIDRAVKSDSEFSRTGHAGNLRGSKAISLAYLGIVYVRQGRTSDALKSVDLAFAEANKANVPPPVVRNVVKIGRAVAQATGDKEAIEKWAQRS